MSVLPVGGETKAAGEDQTETVAAPGAHSAGNELETFRVVWRQISGKSLELPEGTFPVDQ